MKKRRTDALGNGKINAIISAIAEATYKAHRRDVPIYLTNAIRELAIGQEEATFITERIITGSPWRRVDAKPEWITSTNLGQMFEKPLDNRQGRRWATAWANPARNILVSIGKDWWKLIPTAERIKLRIAGIRFPTR